MTEPPVLLRTDLEGLTLRGRGKVRDVYEVAAETPGGEPRLLIVTTDRISAFDVILPQGVPGKGAVLTAVSEFWFRLLADVVPNHLVTTDVDAMPASVRRHADVIRGRAMLVHRCDPFPVECVARGYLAGSGLKEYRAGGTVCGIPLPPGLEESSRLPETLFTPATKAETGHDENIDFDTMSGIVGRETAERLRALTLTLYRRGAAHAESRGILLCDTKFEFGTRGGDIVLIDEALTPDSSRYWEKSRWTPGRPQPSYDKQPVRDWLEASGWDKLPPPPDLPPDVVEQTARRYREIQARLTEEIAA
jgi:phosphoribosylaminoimidazole-succinocarboxamide synthase